MSISGLKRCHFCNEKKKILMVRPLSTSRATFSNLRSRSSYFIYEGFSSGSKNTN